MVEGEEEEKPEKKTLGQKRGHEAIEMPVSFGRSGSAKAQKVKR